MHKDTKWAKQIISMQREDGAWGDFHTRSGSSNSPLTTERALRRLEHLGFTIKDECIERAISYMSDCLSGKRKIPDRREKLVDWDVFTSLMLSTWIRRFTKDVPIANQVADQWGDVISQASSWRICSRGLYCRLSGGFWRKDQRRQTDKVCELLHNIAYAGVSG